MVVRNTLAHPVLRTPGVRSLIQELRFYKVQGEAGKKKKMMDIWEGVYIGVNSIAWQTVSLRDQESYVIYLITAQWM